MSKEQTTVVYMSSVSSNLEIKKAQQHIKMILDGKKIKYEEVDVAADSEAKDKMREIIGDDKALPPKIFKGDTYCGDFQAFNDAVENEKLMEFLKLN